MIHRDYLAPLALLAVTTPLARAQFGVEQEIQSVVGAASDLDVADLDGDGDLDVVAVLSPSIVWHENLGAGTFGVAQLMPVTPSSSKLVTTFDFEDDGDLDVLCTVDFYKPSTGSDHRVVAIKNDGGGVFSGYATLYSDVATDMGLVDYEGDGDLDVYAAFGDVTFVLMQDGFPTGTKVVVTGAASRFVEPADYDGDGDADLLVSTLVGNQSQITWLENLGGGAFGPGVVLNPQVYNGLLLVGSGDIDGDGRLDALSAFSGGSTHQVHWYRNLGAGSFGPPISILSGNNYPRGVEAKDIDGDGNLDVLMTELYGASWCENDGTGAFGPRQEIYQQSAFIEAASAADINGDGAPDVVVGGAGFNPAKLWWLENQVSGPMGSVYCSGVPNTTGNPGQLTAAGSYFVGRNDLLLVADDLPQKKFGIFIASANQVSVPGFGGGTGTLCVAQPKRLPPTKHSGTAGQFSLQLDLTTAMGAPVRPGDTWNFQAWHRDFGGTTNLTDAVTVDFAP